MPEPAQPAHSASIGAGERRHVSVLFADMVGYTAIMEALGEEQSFPFVRLIYEKLASCVREHDGSVHAFGGDSVMAVFGISKATEDAALKACRAALAIQANFAKAAYDIEARFHVRPVMRVGVSSGVAVVAPVDTEGTALTTIGNTVNLASRIETLAPPGGCLICEATRRLIEWQVDLEFDAVRTIKGVAKPQKLWRLLAVHDNASRFDTSRGRGLSPLVGRDENLAIMTEALQQSRQGFRVIDLVAEPGLGKTRLIFEFLNSLQPEDAVVVQGHCGADGQQTPFLPFLEVTRGTFAIGSDDDPRIIASKLESGLYRLGLHSAENLGLLQNLLGLPPSDGSLAGLDGVLIGLRTRDLLPALLAAQCQAARVVLLLEDIHWIDSASEEVLAKLIEEQSPSNLLVILARRPEYVPSWRDASCVTTQSLAPLHAADVVRVATTRLGVDRLPEALVRQVTERAGGNPLFSEEILDFLIEQGALRVEAGEAVFDAAAGNSALPTSLLGLLAARLNRLSQTDRALLQVAAVIGRRFDATLLPHAAAGMGDAEAALRRLQEQDIVRIDADGVNYVFKHVLMRDCVYHSLLAEPRSRLHLGVAKALEHRSAGRVAEVAETLAHHFGQTDRKDLAFTYLGMAGAKSLGVFSHELADQYFAAALALYAADPGCASEQEFAGVLANYALCLNISLSVIPMITLAAEVLPILQRIGDSRDHALFLHHYVSCLVCNARYFDALRVQRELSAMAARLDDREAIAYAPRQRAFGLHLLRAAGNGRVRRKAPRGRSRAYRRERRLSPELLFRDGRLGRGLPRAGGQGARHRRPPCRDRHRDERSSGTGLWRRDARPHRQRYRRLRAGAGDVGASSRRITREVRAGDRFRSPVQRENAAQATGSGRGNPQPSRYLCEARLDHVPSRPRVGAGCRGSHGRPHRPWTSENRGCDSPERTAGIRDLRQLGAPVLV